MQSLSSARRVPIDELLTPFRKAFSRVDEAEFNRLVDEARTYHHERTARKM